VVAAPLKAGRKMAYAHMGGYQLVKEERAGTPINRDFAKLNKPRPYVIKTKGF